MRLLERVREEVGGGQSSLKDMLVSLGYRQTPEQPQTKLKAAKPLGDSWSTSTFNDGWTIWTLTPTHRKTAKSLTKENNCTCSRRAEHARE